MSQRALRGLLFCVFACLASPVASGAESLPRSVLYLDQNDPGEPFAAGMSAAFRSIMNPGSDANVTIYAENLDLIRSPGPHYEALITAYLGEKYRHRPIGVIAAMGTAALSLMLHSRAELWPEVPVVFAGGIPPETKIPPGVTGLVRRQTLRSSVNLARALVPGLKRIALVGDVPLLHLVRGGFSDEIPALAAEVEIIDLRGLRMAELRQRIAASPNDTVIYFTTMTYEGDRPAYVSRDALVSLSKDANRPIIVDLESHVDAGGLGGLVADPGQIGRGAARLALRILDGENATNIPIVTGDFVRPIFDWRQLQRWGIGEKNLPPESEIRFRQPTAWEQYHWQIILIAAALMLQTGLIIGLFYEHRQRRAAEVKALHHMAELAHMNRTATVGELSASIAHELSQPLAAIAANSSAALRWLAKAPPSPHLGEARAALNRVVDDGHRAGQLIGDIRAMYRKDDQQRISLDVNELIREMVALLRDQLGHHEVAVQSELMPELPKVLGNRIQLQQVILNLMMNAAEAMDAVRDRPRMLRLKTELYGSNGVLITVEDSGPGIDPKNIERVFNPLFTTKSGGMGMGLSICRSIVEAHDGRLWASSGNPYGSIFHVLLPTS
jgi:signal transduction histidine kinase